MQMDRVCRLPGYSAPYETPICNWVWVFVTCILSFNWFNRSRTPFHGTDPKTGMIPLLGPGSDDSDSEPESDTPKRKHKSSVSTKPRKHQNKAKAKGKVKAVDPGSGSEFGIRVTAESMKRCGGGILVDEIIHKIDLMDSRHTSHPPLGSEFDAKWIDGQILAGVTSCDVCRHHPVKNRSRRTDKESRRSKVGPVKTGPRGSRTRYKGKGRGLWLQLVRCALLYAQCPNFRIELKKTECRGEQSPQENERKYTDIWRSRIRWRTKSSVMDDGCYKWTLAAADFLDDCKHWDATDAPHVLISGLIMDAKTAEAKSVAAVASV
ncbi:hypothetical protein C8R43DRAFT_948585 [Mycena crocata]|nr:hypothetical protein C8R43DRAFT_948585 [Mycena crocata]